MSASSPLFNATALAIMLAELARTSAHVNICEAESGMNLRGREAPELAHEYIMRETVPLLVYGYQTNQQPGGFKSFGVAYVNPKGDFSDPDDFDIQPNSWNDRSNPLLIARETISMLLDTAEDHELTNLAAVAEGYCAVREWIWMDADNTLNWRA